MSNTRSRIDKLERRIPPPRSDVCERCGGRGEHAFAWNNGPAEEGGCPMCGAVFEIVNFIETEADRKDQR